MEYISKQCSNLLLSITMLIDDIISYSFYNFSDKIKITLKYRMPRIKKKFAYSSTLNCHRMILLIN